MATDAEIRAAGLYAVPQSRFLRNEFQLPTNTPVEEEEETESFGIPNTNAFTNSGNSFNQSGNAFGYGSKIEPVSYGSYNGPGYTGGLPGNVQQYGQGRQFTGDEEGLGPTTGTNSYNKKVPGLLRAGASFVPFGNTLLNFAEKQMNKDGRGPSNTYGIGGLSEAQKGAYNKLAGQGMLFNGSSGFKTLTGKNFNLSDKQFDKYMSGQRGIYDDMTEKGYGIDEDGTVTFNGKPLKSTQKNLSNRFKESSALFKGEKEKKENKAAAQIERAKKGQAPSDPGDRGRDDTPGFGKTSAGNYTNQFQGGDPGLTMADGGRAGYFFGGRVNYKAGGRIGFAGGGMDAGKDSDFGSEDFGGDKGDNREQYGAVGQYSKGPTSTNNNDGNDGNEKTTFIQKIKNNPIINNPLTRMVGRVGMYSVNPSLMGLDYRTAMQAKEVYDTAINEIDEDDVTLNKYKQGGRVSFKNGGLASIL